MNIFALEVFKYLGFATLLDNELNIAFFWAIVSVFALALAVDALLILYGGLFSNPGGGKSALARLSRIGKQFASSSDRFKTLDCSKIKFSNSALRFVKANLACRQDGSDLIVELIGGRLAARQSPSQFVSLQPACPFKSVPAVLTAAGILGTFLGITIALEKIDFSILAKTDQMLAVTTSLLDGMKVAFATSLFGMSTSILFMFWIILSSATRSFIHRYYWRKWSRITTPKTALDLLERFDPEQSVRAAQALSETATRLDPAILAREMALGVSAAIRDGLEPIFIEIRNELKQLKDIKSDHGQETIKSLIGGLRDEVIGPMSENLTSNTRVVLKLVEHVANLRLPMTKLTEEMEKTIRQIGEFQTETLNRLESFSSNLSSGLTSFTSEIEKLFKEKIADTMKEVGTSASSLMNRAAENLTATLDGFFQKLSSNLDHFQNNTKDVFVDLSENVNKSIEAQRTAFVDSSKKVVETFDGLSQKLSKALSERTVEEKRVLELFNDTLDGQAQQLKRIGEEASKLMGEAHGSLKTGLENIGGMLAEMRRQGQTELQGFMKAYQDALNGFFQEQNKTLGDVLGQQREGLSRVIFDLQEAFKSEAEQRQRMAAEVDASMKKVQEAAFEVGRLVNAVGLHSGERVQQLGIMAEDVARQVERLSDLYTKSGDHLKQGLAAISRDYVKLTHHFDECLQKANDHLAGYLDKVLRAKDEYVDIAEKSLADILGKIHLNAQYLVNAVEHQSQNAELFGTRPGGNGQQGVSPTPRLKSQHDAGPSA